MTEAAKIQGQDLDFSRYKLGWSDEDKHVFKAKKGLNEAVVREMSEMKGEEPWMLNFRLRALKKFEQKPMAPWFATRMPDLDFQDIYYYLKSTEGQVDSWEDLPPEIKNTYDRLGIPEAERDFLAGVTAQYESEVVFHRNRADLESLGVLFCDMDTAVRDYPEIVQKYFATVIPPNDNKFAALNSAVWSGGSFIYVPPGVKVDQPLQAYFRINAQNMGQFERTLIIADEGSSVRYVEGCSSPIYSSNSLHSAVVELVALPGATINYSTVQSWSANVLNLVTKRARAEEGARVEWVDGNSGCLAEGSRIVTPDGMRTIESLEVGDMVQSLDEGTGELVFRKVIAKRYSGTQPVREVRLGSSVLLATDNHPFYSYRYDPTRAKKLGRYSLDYVRVDELEKAVVPIGALAYGRPHRLRSSNLVTAYAGGNQYATGFAATRERSSRLVGVEETTDDIMWLFGLFVGDGSIEKEMAANDGLRWGRVTFSVPTTDRARARLERVMGEIMPGATPGGRADNIVARWSSVELVSFFEDNEFLTGAHIKRIPPWVLDLPQSQRLSFIAGYLDSDGCAPKGQRDFSIKSVNLPLLHDTAVILTSLGITSRMHTEFDEERTAVIMGATVTTRGSHTLVFRTDERLIPLVSEGLRAAVARCSGRVNKSFRAVSRSNIQLPENLELRTVRVGETQLTAPTWDIEVEGTGNFVAEGFVVHNSKLTMKYPSVYLMGPKASGEVLSVAYAGAGQIQDTGAKMIHVGRETTSLITAKSIAKDGGDTTYRGLVKVEEGAVGAKSFVRCDALILDERSTSETKPAMEVSEQDASIGHEATVSKIGDDQLFYLQSRGLTETQAMSMIVNGFMEPVVRALPMEYAVEWSRLIEIQMDGAIG